MSIRAQAQTAKEAAAVLLVRALWRGFLVVSASGTPKKRRCQRLRSPRLKSFERHQLVATVSTSALSTMISAQAPPVSNILMLFVRYHSSYFPFGKRL